MKTISIKDIEAFESVMPKILQVEQDVLLF